MRHALTFTLTLLITANQAAWAQQDPTASAAAPTSAPVGVARLDSVWQQPEREAPASVIARNESRLSAEVAGTLLRWTVDVGDQVRRGQVLAQIDPRDAELAVQRARAALDGSRARLQLAQTQLQRSRDLVAQGFYSREALNQRETELALIQSELKSNEAQWATARRQLDKTTLRAPFAASVKERLAQTGEAVAPGSVLFVLTEAGAAEVEATLSLADVAGLRAGQDLRFTSRGVDTPVRLLRIASALNTPSRTLSARLAFAGEALPAGTSGSLRWRDAAPHIPPQLLVRRQGVLGVFVPRGEGVAAKARFVPLPGAQEGRAAPLPAGLGADTPVIVNGQSALQDGAAISVVRPGTSAPKPAN